MSGRHGMGVRASPVSACLVFCHLKSDRKRFIPSPPSSLKQWHSLCWNALRSHACLWSYFSKVVTFPIAFMAQLWIPTQVTVVPDRAVPTLPPTLLWLFFGFGNKLLLVGYNPNINIIVLVSLQCSSAFPAGRATQAVHPKLLHISWTIWSFRNCVSAWILREDNLFPYKLVYKLDSSLQIENYIGRCEHTTRSQSSLSYNKQKKAQKSNDKINYTFLSG